MKKTDTLRIGVIEPTALFRKSIAELFSQVGFFELAFIDSSPHSFLSRKHFELDFDVIFMRWEKSTELDSDFTEFLNLHMFPVVIISDENVPLSNNLSELLSIGSSIWHGTYDSANIVKDPYSYVFYLLDKCKTAVFNFRLSLNHVNKPKMRKKPGATMKPARQPANRLLLIGSSTGGPQALMTILRGLPANFPPIIIVQHMPGQYTKSFADRLNANSDVHVSEAFDGQLIEEGNAYICPGGKQASLRPAGGQLRLSIGGREMVSGHCPSADVLFNSSRALDGYGVVGLLLTGMGRDGAEGLLTMKGCGYKTFAQDEESSVVFGMPKAAADLGAVEGLWPLGEISENLERLWS